MHYETFMFVINTAVLFLALRDTSVVIKYLRASIETAQVLARKHQTRIGVVGSYKHKDVQ